MRKYLPKSLKYDDIKEWVLQNREIVFYLFFGCCTVGINYITYIICFYPLGVPNAVSNIISWVLSTVFAFLTNRRYVFESRDPDRLWKEAFGFFSCRIGTGLVELFLMWLGVDILGIHGFIAKFIVTVIVTILNYIASKFLVFKKKDA